MDETKKGLIAWFARNSVAANLLMIIIIIGGLLSAGSIRKQFFPQVEINWIEFHAGYPGAAPQEVEEGITIKIEEALERVQGLDRVITHSNRNSSSGYIRIEESYDPQIVLDEVKSQVDSISSFPDDMEQPRIERIKMRQEVMYISLYGDLSLTQLKDLGRNIHDEIQQLPLINITEFYSGLPYEIGIEVSKDKLREYDLKFTDVAMAVRNFSRNMSAGQIRAENGYINLRVENQAYRGHEFETIPVIFRPDGTKVLMGEVATIHDGFQEGIQYSKFNGKNSVTFFIGAAENQSITKVADVMRKYVEQKQHDLPKGVNIDSWVDMTYYLQGRLDLMLGSMKTGAILVFIMLALFLRVRLAFWVMMGLPVCFLGTLLLMPSSFIDVTINVISLFAFILVLGIVVDDAIVMGESAHDEIERSGHSIESVIRGVQRVAMPATFGVLTTIAAFFPLVVGEGPSSAFSQAIGFVVIFCLIFSLIESKLILPAHLAGMKPKLDHKKNKLDHIRAAIDSNLKSFIDNVYRPALQKWLNYRYAIVAVFISLILICSGLFAGGFIKFIGQPKIPHDFPQIKLDMQIDASEKSTLSAILAIEKSVRQVDKHVEQQYGQAMISDISIRLNGRTSAELQAKLVDPDLRPIGTFELAELWRQALPQIAGLKSLTIQDNLFGGGRDDGDVSFKLKGKDESLLLLAAQELKDKLNSIKGVGDVNDSRQSSAKEVQFKLKPLAYSLGLSLADVASQVGHSFYGLEAQRIMRAGEEIKVMIRYPLEQRSSISHVKDVMIVTKNGVEVPLVEVAEINLTKGVNRIRRENGNRTINIWGSVDAKQIEPFAVAKEINENFMPKLLKKYPGVTSKLSGKVQEELEAQEEQFKNFVISMLIIYSLLAIPLKSYSQPIMIMSVIPFGVIGSVIGHMIFGLELSALSLFGIIAAAGVVVNDSLVMVDYVNKSRCSGVTLHLAVLNAGCRRFRAIMLTSLTTFIGVVPIMLETSMQAQMVIPMAVSLSFGVLFATVVTLVLVPCLYLVIEDIKKIFGKKQQELTTMSLDKLN